MPSYTNVVCNPIHDSSIQMKKMSQGTRRMTRRGPAGQVNYIMTGRERGGKSTLFLAIFFLFVVAGVLECRQVFDRGLVVFAGASPDPSGLSERRWEPIAAVNPGVEPPVSVVRFDPPPLRLSHRTRGPATLVADARAHYCGRVLRPLQPKKRTTAA